ncbi:hypothetical protein B0H66DRAFT_377711 [Apodospora peruviana]|uniref:Uncharacterized protein n=1 Tax=Apodospora peruviana TaxID=516989 RepID=A0AAE0LYP7_9PEZI|nr:hypothetical protein B0H66DRAFT_377711 [Apodospora peruviana]
MVVVASCISQLKWRHMQQQHRPLHHLQIFDDASRGPWGSTVMLSRVSVGSLLGWALALVSVGGLGIEPSAQNILDFQLQMVNLTNTTAEVAMAHQHSSKASRHEKYLAPDAITESLDLPSLQARS